MNSLKYIHGITALAAVLGAAVLTGCGDASAQTMADVAEYAQPVLVATQTNAPTDAVEDRSDVPNKGWYIDGTGERFYYDDDGVAVTGIVTINGLAYRFAPDGAQCVGWQTVDNKRYYYDPQTGSPRFGWLDWQGDRYYIAKSTGKKTGELKIETISSETRYRFDKDGVLQTGHFSDDAGNRYYADASGVLATGNVLLEDGWYQFGADGVQQLGWVTIEGQKHYFDPLTGERKTGLLCLHENYYYLTAEKGMQVGWQKIESDTWFFLPETGTAVTGIWHIDEVPYYFDEACHLVTNQTVTVDGVKYQADGKGVLTEIPVITDLPGQTHVMGTAVATEAQMRAYIQSVNPNVAQSVLDMIPYYLSEGEIEGVRGDIAFAQSCLETGNFAFRGSAVTLSQNNFCGLGVTSNGMKGNSFATPQLGIRAQIQHLKAYADTGSLVQEQIDPRFQYVQRGCAPYVEWLGIQENPSGRGWAAGANYGDAILRIWRAILAMQV